MTTAVSERAGILERIAAIVALVSAPVALAVAMFGAVSNWQGSLMTAVGVVVIIVGCWYVMLRRGAVHTVAALSLPLGFALLIAGIVFADTSIARVIAVLVLAAVSVASARFALHRSIRAMRRVALTQTAVPAALRPTLIINPESGGGKAEKFGLVAACRQRGIEPIELQLGDDLIELAEQAVARGADAIGMAGGDGSQALVASVAARHDIPHVVVPAGTRNHFALDLGLDRSDVVGALDAFHDGIEHRIDLATVNDRVFVNNASVGLYAKIVQSPDYRDAKRKTTAELLPALLGPDATPMDLRFTGPDGTPQSTAMIILISNNAYELHRLAGGGTRERIDLGVLGIVAARISSAAELARFVALEAAGQPHRFSGWLEWSAPRFRIDSDAPVEIGVDGEALTLDPPLVFGIEPLALRVRVPRRAIGRSPAATSVHVLSHVTIAELCRVAAGQRSSV